MVGTAVPAQMAARVGLVQTAVKAAQETSEGMAATAAMGAQEGPAATVEMPDILAMAAMVKEETSMSPPAH